MMKLYTYRNLFLGLLVATLLVTPAFADASKDTNWIELAQAPGDDGSTPPGKFEEPEPVAEEGGWEKPIPIGFTLDYTLVSDYIWRGANFSEFDGEGREDLNHQIGAGVSLDLPEELGTVGFSVWWEIYMSNTSDRFDPAATSDLQEVDYTLNWTKDFDSVGVGVELGWIAYTFPNLGGDSHTSYEVYGALSFNDGMWFGLEEGILNPYVAYYYDYDVVEGGWFELGFSHEFALSEYAEELKDFTVTPSVVIGIDNRYWDKALGTNHTSTKLGAINYGVEVGYDLSSALAIPEKYGSVSLAGFVNYSDAIRSELLDDEFYGGLTVAYGW